MESKYYKILFTGGELSGRSFVVPAEGVMIGKSQTAGIRPGGEDIAIQHASLFVRESDSSLILKSHAESVFVDNKQLEPGMETELKPGMAVRLGKQLFFGIEEEVGSIPVVMSSPFSPDDDETTEDGTVDGGAESGGKTEDKTRYASEEELDDLRRFSQKQTSRRKFTFAFAVILLLAVIGGGFLYSELELENPVTWPGEVTGDFNDGEFRIELPPKGNFLIYYPECSKTQVEKTETNCEVMTLLGKHLDVVFHLKLVVNDVPDGFVVSRKDSFSDWKKDAEENHGYTFLKLPEDKFYSISTCGIPYQTMGYKRNDNDFQWQGFVSYLRYHDKEIIFTREVPVQHYWRAEKVLTNYGCFVASPDAANSYWEIPETIPEGVSKTELYRTLLSKMMVNVAITDWTEIKQKFALLLSLAGKANDEEMMEDALGLLQDFRERQALWYAQACLAYQHYEQSENWLMMRDVVNICLSKFPSPDDYRHLRIMQNIWTLDE